jgi:hypothetical protein
VLAGGDLRVVGVDHFGNEEPVVASRTLEDPRNVSTSLLHDRVVQSQDVVVSFDWALECRYFRHFVLLELIAYDLII